MKEIDGLLDGKVKVKVEIHRIVGTSGHRNIGSSEGVVDATFIVAG